jgi:predicted dehydrogenase
VAIASRDRTRGQKYADAFSIKTVYDKYEDLAKDAQIDAVYVSTINPLHFAAVKLLLEHKKAVLCEKPLVIR